MARLDWAKLSTMFNLGGYALSADLSDRTALLALVGLDQMRSKYAWVDYTDADEIESALAEAMSEIMNGVLDVGDYVKIAEATSEEDCSDLTADNFLAGDWRFYKVLISGLKTDYGANWPDGVIMSFSGDTTSANYNSFARFFSTDVNYNYQYLGTQPGILMPWVAKSDAYEDDLCGSVEITIFAPLAIDYHNVQYQGMVAGVIDQQIAYTIGSGVYTGRSAVYSISIKPHYGTGFVVGSPPATRPSILRMSVYGMR